MFLPKSLMFLGDVQIMKRFIYFAILCSTLSYFPVYSAVQSPADLIENFYSSRKFMKKEHLENLGFSQLSNAGKRAAEEALYDYTVLEISDTGSSVSYAEVEIKKRSSDSGIIVQKEYWKMIKDDGRWVIKNIYTPEEWQTKKVFRPGSSLSERVEALALFEFEYQIEEVPPGTPLQKAYAYIARKEYNKALSWASVSVSQKKDAESFFLRGILNLVLKNQEQGVRDVNTAIKMDQRYYYVLQSLLNKSSNSSGGSVQTQDPATKTMKGGVQSLFQK
jgi:hypothetical protein